MKSEFILSRIAKNTKLGSRFPSFILAVALAAALAITFDTVAQPELRSAASTEKLLKQRSQEIISIKCDFIVSVFDTAKFRQNAFKDHLVVNTTPADSNRVEAFRWSADTIRWRTDSYRYYPTVGIDPLSQSAFDGEKYYRYDPSANLATVTATPQVEGFTFHTVVDSYFLGLRQWDYFKEEVTNEKNVDFKPVLQEEVNGYKCTRYDRKAKDYLASIWVCFEGGSFIVKARREFQNDKGSGALVLLQFSDFKGEKGILLPHKTVEERYDIRKGSNFWIKTRIFRIDRIQVNVKFADDIFSDPLRIGSLLLDEIESPGIAQRVGPEPSGADIENVLTGSYPPLSEDKVEAIGVAPEVTEFQRQLMQKE